jgi:glucuronate isomerase
MKPYLDDDFLLESDLAQELYHQEAANLPIYDYHCHLPPQQIADNHPFRNLYEIWLAGDHYKWRAMRTNGVSERFCTGDAPDYDKFLAYAATVPYCLRNPLYDWTHLELKRFFGIERRLDSFSAEGIWHEANEKLARPSMTARGILASNRVAVVCTTDDPADSLDAHARIQADPGMTTSVYPTFRPDKALALGNLDAWNAWVDRLSERANTSCDDFTGFLDALKNRHDAFHQVGARLSDHGLECALADDCSDNQAASIFRQARAGEPSTESQIRQFGSYLMLYFGRLDSARGWTKQLHLGAMRNNNSKLFAALGPDTGFDSIGDFTQGRALARYLDKLDQTHELPKTVIYNLNPADNYLMAAMIGNFQGGNIPGKIQWGSGWWFLDQLEGMTWQLNALSNLGLLRRFVGMLTDSRSFLSYSRHEYFRRLLCHLLGGEATRGRLPHDRGLLAAMVRDIGYYNAKSYFGLTLRAPYSES